MMVLKSHKAEKVDLMKTLDAIVRDTGEGEQRWFCGGGLHTWKATSQETDGAFLLFEDQLDLGKVTPLHRHPDADETFYMLEGEVLLHIDGEKRPLLAGGIAIIPRGIPHAFLVTSAQARMLCLQTPGSGEDFYRLASESAAAGDPPAPIDFDRVRAAAAQTGAIELLGPPPF
jgi:quercetin dioxygenase-like cupin family protein